MFMYHQCSSVVCISTTWPVRGAALEMHVLQRRHGHPRIYGGDRQDQKRPSFQNSVSMGTSMAICCIYLSLVYHNALFVPCRKHLCPQFWNHWHVYNHRCGIKCKSGSFSVWICPWAICACYRIGL